MSCSTCYNNLPIMRTNITKNFFNIFAEIVWPLPSTYIPYNLMSKKEEKEKADNTEELFFSSHMPKFSVQGLNAFY